MRDANIDFKKLSKIISSVFMRMIFEKGFVHSDPHPGNMYVRPHPHFKDEIELVILDHGIYTELTKETRLSYAKLWRGILNQRKDLIKDASREMGCEQYELFTAMIVNRTFDEVMDGDKKG